MLRRVIRSALPLFAVNSRQTILAKPVYNFGSIKPGSKNQLSTLLQEEINLEEQQKTDLSQYVNFFENEGYTVKYDGIQVELSKKNGSHNLRILFNAKTPASFDENEEQTEEEQQQQENADFTQVLAYINKEGSNKWLAVEFFVADECQISQATFIEDYNFEKSQRKKGRAPLTGYSGPQLSTLDENLQNAVYEFIEITGLNGEVLKRASEFSVAYEHQFYIDWLKDLKSIA